MEKQNTPQPKAWTTDQQWTKEGIDQMRIDDRNQLKKIRPQTQMAAENSRFQINVADKRTEITSYRVD